jgi:hypothetical protein
MTESKVPDTPLPELRFVRRPGLIVLQQRWCINSFPVVFYEWRDVPVEKED